MANIITIPAGLIKVSDQRDRSCTLTFETRELENSEFMALRDIRGMEGWLAFALNQIQMNEIPKTPAKTGVKSSAQRMRAVIFIKWKQLNSPLDFEVFYEAEMNHDIEAKKRELMPKDS